MTEPDGLAEAEGAAHLEILTPDSALGGHLALLMVEYDRRGAIEQRALEVNGDPNSSNEAVEVSRYILGETS